MDRLAVDCDENISLSDTLLLGVHSRENAGDLYVVPLLPSGGADAGVAVEHRGNCPCSCRSPFRRYPTMIGRFALATSFNRTSSHFGFS